MGRAFTLAPHQTPPNHHQVPMATGSWPRLYLMSWSYAQLTERKPSSPLLGMKTEVGAQWTDYICSIHCNEAFSIDEHWKSFLSVNRLQPSYVWRMYLDTWSILTRTNLHWTRLENDIFIKQTLNILLIQDTMTWRCHLSKETIWSQFYQQNFHFINKDTDLKKLTSGCTIVTKTLDWTCEPVLVNRDSEICHNMLP